MPRRLNYQGRGSPGSMTKVMLDGNLTAWEISPGSNTPLDRWSGELLVVVVDDVDVVV